MDYERQWLIGMLRHLGRGQAGARRPPRWWPPWRIRAVGGTRS